MKLKASVKDLTNALNKIVPFIGTEKMFECILFDVNQNQMIIKSTNGNVHSSVRLNVESNDSFQFVVKGKDFNSLINTFKSFVDIEIDDKTILIKEGKTKLKLNIININAFPVNLSDVNGEEFEIDMNYLSDGLTKTVDFLDVKSMGAISGINLNIKDNVLNIMGTDGKRASICEYPAETQNNNFILPLFIAKELIKITDETVKISISNNFIKFSFNDFTIISNMIIGEFPPIKNIIPKDYTNVFRCSKTLIDDFLKRVNLLNKVKNYAITIKLEEDKLELFYSNTDNELREVFDVEYKCENIEIKVNYQYLQNIIKNFEDKITMKFGHQNSSIILFENEENTMVLAKLQ